MMSIPRTCYRIAIVLVLLVLICCAASASNVNVNSTSVFQSYITIDPIRNHTIGEVFLINGTTNLPVSEELAIHVYPVNPTYGGKGRPEPGIVIANIPIISGTNGVNLWSVNVTDGYWTNEKFIVKIWSTKFVPQEPVYQLFTLLANNTIPFQITSTIGNIQTGTAVTTNAENQNRILESYRKNLTYPKKKIPENLLRLIDPNYPVIGMTPDQVREMMIESNQLIPAKEAIRRFNLSTTDSQSVGDQVYLYIYIKPSASTHIVDPISTEVTDRDENWHLVMTWVDINNLEKLAALENVTGMMVVIPPEHSDPNVTITGQGFKPTPDVDSLTIHTPLQINTPAAPLSIWVPFISLIFSGIVIIFFRPVEES